MSPMARTIGCISWTARRSKCSTTFGEGGRQPGEFYGVHSIATDSKGNIYTTETYRGQRVQQFVYKGHGAGHQQRSARVVAEALRGE